MAHAIHYTITPHCLQHEYLVELYIDTPGPEGVCVSLPAWIPGSYLVRDFAKNIVEIAAQTSDGAPLAISKRDKDSWLLAPHDGPVIVRYRVYAWDISVRTAYLDETRAFFNGTSVFLQVHGAEACPQHVSLKAPQAADDGWSVATAMQAVEVDDDGFGDYVAPNYDELIDHPVEMGRLHRLSFTVADIPHEMVFVGHDGCEGLSIDFPRIAKDVQQACEHHVALFGELPPIERYVFMTMVVGEGYGGLEHRASTALLCSYEDLPRLGEDDVNERYRNFLGLCSHEYFHTWNVKRIKPAAFTPFDYQRENYTQLLWAFEGITSYYDDYSLCRTQLITPESYLELVGRLLTRLARNPGRLRQSVCESSFDAWTKFYKQDESAPNVIVSYYVKGAVIALMLDLKLRQASLSLDDVMRLLWQRYGDEETGVPEHNGVDGVQQAINDVAGQDWSMFFAQALHGTDDLPVAEHLVAFGVECSWRTAANDADVGGKPAKGLAVATGMRVRGHNGGVKIQQVLSNSAGEAAGLAAGDQLVALNDARVSLALWNRQLARARVGDIWQIHYFRRDELRSASMVVQAAPLDTCHLRLMDDDVLEESVAQRRHAWLGV